MIVNYYSFFLSKLAIDSNMMANRCMNLMPYKKSGEPVGYYPRHWAGLDNILCVATTRYDFRCKTSLSMMKMMFDAGLVILL